jgi:hypothetical protein
METRCPSKERPGMMHAAIITESNSRASCET